MNQKPNLAQLGAGGNPPGYRIAPLPPQSEEEYILYRQHHRGQMGSRPDGTSRGSSIQLTWKIAFQVSIQKISTTKEKKTLIQERVIKETLIGLIIVHHHP